MRVSRPLPGLYDCDQIAEQRREIRGAEHKDDPRRVYVDPIAQHDGRQRRRRWWRRRRCQQALPSRRRVRVEPVDGDEEAVADAGHQDTAKREEHTEGTDDGQGRTEQAAEQEEEEVAGEEG